MIEALKWCGFEPNEGLGFGNGEHAPYRQSERKQMYRQYAEQLISSGNAYYAFDSSEELEEMRKRTEAAGGTHSYNAVTRQNMKNSLTLSEDEVKIKLAAGEHYVIRIKLPRNEEVRVKDLIRGWVVVHTSQMDDKVLFKSDGMPTYHLANVVDDYLMKITHVIRGEEWLPSAPLHVLLYRYLGWEKSMPEFAHLPLLLRPDGNGKLSKRDGDLGDQMAFWTAPRATGPFTPAEPVADLPADPDTGAITYMPLAHPQIFAEPGTMVTSYSNNNTDPQKIKEDPTLYRPTFLRVPLPR